MVSWRSHWYGRSRLIIIAHDAGIENWVELCDLGCYDHVNEVGSGYGCNIYRKLTVTHKLTHEDAVQILEGVAGYTDAQARFVASDYS
jgi:hypothetical protein